MPAENPNEYFSDVYLAKGEVTGHGDTWHYQRRQPESGQPYGGEVACAKMLER
jgi:hypothetical protein